MDHPTEEYSRHNDYENRYGPGSRHEPPPTHLYASHRRQGTQGLPPGSQRAPYRRPDLDHPSIHRSYENAHEREARRELPHEEQFRYGGNLRHHFATQRRSRRSRSDQRATVRSGSSRSPKRFGSPGPRPDNPARWESSVPSQSPCRNTYNGDDPFNQPHQRSQKGHERPPHASIVHVPQPSPQSPNSRSHSQAPGAPLSRNVRGSQDYEGNRAAATRAQSPSERPSTSPTMSKANVLLGAHKLTSVVPSRTKPSPPTASTNSWKAQSLGTPAGAHVFGSLQRSSHSRADSHHQRYLPSERDAGQEAAPTFRVNPHDNTKQVYVPAIAHPSQSCQNGVSNRAAAEQLKDQQPFSLAPVGSSREGSQHLRKRGQEGKPKRVPRLPDPTPLFVRDDADVVNLTDLPDEYSSEKDSAKRRKRERTKPRGVLLRSVPVEVARSEVIKPGRDAPQETAVGTVPDRAKTGPSLDLRSRQRLKTQDSEKECQAVVIKEVCPTSTVPNGQPKRGRAASSAKKPFVRAMKSRNVGESLNTVLDSSSERRKAPDLDAEGVTAKRISGWRQDGPVSVVVETGLTSGCNRERQTGDPDVQLRRRPNVSLESVQLEEVPIPRRSPQAEESAVAKDWEIASFDLERVQRIFKRLLVEQATLLVLSFCGMATGDLRNVLETCDLTTNEPPTEGARLQLNNNRLRQFPNDLCDQIAKMNISSLHLACNKLSYLGPKIGRWAKLRFLDLSRNSLGHVPQEICDLTSLEVLNLSHNEIDRLPPGLGRLEKLQILNVAGNNLEVLPDDVAHQGAVLNALDVSRNSEFRFFPKCAENWKDLEDLDLSGTKIFRLLLRKDRTLKASELVKELAGKGEQMLADRRAGLRPRSI